MTKKIRKQVGRNEKGCAKTWKSSLRGYVYILVAGPFVKIGVTTSSDPYARIKGIQTGCPFEVKPATRLECYRINPFDVESYLHEVFSNLHVRGEWFMNEGGLKKLIKFCKGMNGGGPQINGSGLLNKLISDAGCYR